MNPRITVALFVYIRPEHTRATLEALARNTLARETEVLVFSDGPKKPEQAARVDAVRSVVREAKGFASLRLVEREQNFGLARSLVTGITEAFASRDRLIVLEDDIVTSPDFLSYLWAALDRYQSEPSVFSVTGFQFPIPVPKSYAYDAYFSYRSSSWGWGTWKDRWNQVDWNVTDYAQFRRDRAARRAFNRGGDDLSDMLDRQMHGEIDSWAIRWAYAHFRHQAFCLFPVMSRVQNIGFDGSGTHCEPLEGVNAELSEGVSEATFRFPPPGERNEEILAAFSAFNSLPIRTKMKLWLRNLAREFRGQWAQE